MAGWVWHWPPAVETCGRDRPHLRTFPGKCLAARCRVHGDSVEDTGYPPWREIAVIPVRPVCLALLSPTSEGFLGQAHVRFEPGGPTSLRVKRYLAWGAPVGYWRNRPGDKMATTVVCWNIAKCHEPWRQLVQMDADLALLQEVGSVPPDVAERVCRRSSKVLRVDHRKCSPWGWWF